MVVEHSGWSEDRGLFYDRYFVDTDKTDMVIKWTKGGESKQSTHFCYEEKDWNNDYEVYVLFGAVFDGVFYTPQDLVRIITENEAKIEGVMKI